jgi:hypothetical protein
MLPGVLAKARSPAIYLPDLDTLLQNNSSLRRVTFSSILRLTYS